jgi:hypothetical protein
MPKKNNMSWHSQYVNKSVRDKPADISGSVLRPSSPEMSVIWLCAQDRPSAAEECNLGRFSAPASRQRSFPSRLVVE